MEWEHKVPRVENNFLHKSPTEVMTSASAERQMGLKTTERGTLSVRSEFITLSSEGIRAVLPFCKVKMSELNMKKEKCPRSARGI